MIDSKIKSKPLLRWVGGKNWLSKTIENIIPSNFNKYHEPFLGGAAIFFSITPQCAYLSDINQDLINFYLQVKSNPKKLIEFIEDLKNNKIQYYKIRNLESTNLIEKAARFYYLNRTCFNGIYRVNKKGIFNVPFGFRKEIAICNVEEILRVSKMLSNVVLNTCDFFETLPNIGKGDFVFIDPPYTVAHNKNGFLSYNQKIFSWEDQERLFQYVQLLINKEAYFVLTNADHFSIKTLYKGLCKIRSVARYSTIGGQGAERKKITELLITNCF